MEINKLFQKLIGITFIMKYIETRTKIADLFLHDSLIPKERFDDIYEDIKALHSYEYKRGLIKNLLPFICDKNIKLDREILREAESNYKKDPFLWLLNGLINLKLKYYQKSIQVFMDFLQYNKGFFLNSFILVKVSKCYIKSRKYNQYLKNIETFLNELRPAHRFIILGFKGYSNEMLGNSEAAKMIYSQIIDINCRSSL